MSTSRSARTRLHSGLFAATAVAGLLAVGGANGASSGDATVVELSQTGCQFVESENGIDHGYAPKSADDCKAINQKTGGERLDTAKVLKLKPGKYVFRVTHENVPYELGFWLRGEGLLGRATLPSVSGGGLTAGATRDYAIELEPGEYLYSCSLNPTPDYRLVVEG